MSISSVLNITALSRPSKSPMRGCLTELIFTCLFPTRLRAISSNTSFSTLRATFACTLAVSWASAIMSVSREVLCDLLVASK